MNFEEFSKELSNKKRTIADLSRFISTRTDQNPNYTLLLGAGCSVSSGVRSAFTLANLWREDLYKAFASREADPNASIEAQREFLKKTQVNWYETAREYSSLFEKRYDLQRQRRMFVEMEVATKTPSIGYAYLTALVQQNFFNTVFTTNFDDLLNEAFYLYSEQRPIVCAHDSSINSVTVTSKRPKIIKLHGDYLFDDLKSTIRETETLEQNMKAKFTEFSKDYGLIVVGYSGGDRSIMDVLSALLKNEEYLKSGIYWCIRKGSEVSEELRKLMWRERVYFVEIDGFDELFAEFYCNFNNGDVLPANALTISRRPSDIAAKLLSSKDAFPASSDVLRRARERLEKQTKRTALVNLIVNPDNEENSRSFSNSDLNDDDLIILMEIENLISSEQYRQAIEKARENLRIEAKVSVKLRLLRSIIQAYKALDNSAEALTVAEELISLQPKNSAHYLLKASIVKRRDDRLLCIESAIKIDPYSVDGYLEKGRLLVSRAKREYGIQRQNLFEKAREALDHGLVLDPNWRNTIWREKFDLVSQQIVDKVKCKCEQQNIVEELKKQNPFTTRVLTMQQIMLSDKDEPMTSIKLLADIEEGRDRANPNNAFLFDAIKLKVLAKLGDVSRLESAVKSMRANEKIEEHNLAITLASILRKQFGKDSDAKEILLRSLKNEFDVDALVSLIECHLDLKEYVEANELFKKWQKKISNSSRHLLLCNLKEAEGEFEESLNEMKRYEDETGVSRKSHIIYLDLRLKKYTEAQILARSVLEPINFSIDAVEEIVNHEFACKKLGKKVNAERLENVMNFAKNARTSAAVYALLERRSEMLDSLKKAMKEDKTFRFEAADWPVFEGFQSEEDFNRAVAI